MKIKKIVALGIGAVAILGSIAGCTVNPPVFGGQEITSVEQIQSLVNQAKQEGVNSVDITQDNSAVVADATNGLISQDDVNTLIEEQKAKDAQVIADYKAEAERLKAEEEAEEQETETKLENSYENDDLILNSLVPAFTLDDSDLDFLQDTKIELDDDKYDIHEELSFSNVGIRTSLYDEDFDGDVYLTLEDKNSIVYKYVFDDKIDTSSISEDEPLNINFLGNDIEITDVDSDSFIVTSGVTDMLGEGDNKKIAVGEDVYDVTLSIVTDSAPLKAKFTINGETTDAMEEDDVYKLEDGSEIKVKEILSNEAGDATKDIVEFVIAKDVDVEYETGDLVIEDDDRFEYVIEVASGELEYLGVSYVEKSDGVDDDFPPIKLAETYDFLGLFSVGLELEDVDYNDFTISFDEENSQDVLVIESDEDEGIAIGNDEVDTIYFNGTNVFYDDDDNDEQVANLSDVKLVSGDTELSLSYSGTVLTIGDINITTDGTFNNLGDAEDEAEAKDVIYKGDNKGTMEESLITDEGIIIEDIEDNADNDEVVISVPSDDVTATIIVG